MELLNLKSALRFIFILAITGEAGEALSFMEQH